MRNPEIKNPRESVATKILGEITEEVERGTQQEFLNYLYIAKGSAGEVRAQLYVALDAGYLNIEMFKYLNGLALECSRLVQSFAEKVKGGARRGTQFKQIQKPDVVKELLKQSAPQVYEKFYNEKI